NRAGGMDGDQTGGRFSSAKAHERRDQSPSLLWVPCQLSLMSDFRIWLCRRRGCLRDAEDSGLSRANMSGSSAYLKHRRQRRNFCLRLSNTALPHSSVIANVAGSGTDTVTMKPWL